MYCLILCLIEEYCLFSILIFYEKKFHEFIIFSYAIMALLSVEPLSALTDKIF